MTPIISFSSMFPFSKTVRRTLLTYTSSVISYPLSIVNTFVAGALIHLYLHREKYNWHPPVRATLPVTILFLLSNIYLVLAPFVPPSEGQNVYEELPYYLHCVVGIGIIVAGGFYWVIWAKIMPWWGKYELGKAVVVQGDGWTRNVFTKKYLE